MHNSYAYRIVNYNKLCLYSVILKSLLLAVVFPFIPLVTG